MNLYRAWIKWMMGGLMQLERSLFFVFYKRFATLHDTMAPSYIYFIVDSTKMADPSAIYTTSCIIMHRS